MVKNGILLESGTNEVEILEFVLWGRASASTWPRSRPSSSTTPSA